MSNQNLVAVIPARDEALSITQVVSAIKTLESDDGLPLFERIVVCDNASTDNTASLAKVAGAEVVTELTRGYGSACLAALAQIHAADIVVFFDADASLNINNTHDLLAAIDQGADLVIGARTPAKREPGSMTPAQLFGNWLAGRLIRVIWKKPVSDLGPFRAIRFDALQRLQMQDKKFGWTVEMQVKSIQYQFNMVEVAVEYRRRIGQSKISGTLTGTLGAGYGTITTIIKLALNPPVFEKHTRSKSHVKTL
jgi:glycosyltransferase involved in cell wall biosynthesis